MNSVTDIVEVYDLLYRLLLGLSRLTQSALAIETVAAVIS